MMSRLVRNGWHQRRGRVTAPVDTTAARRQHPDRCQGTDSHATAPACQLREQEPRVSRLWRGGGRCLPEQCTARRAHPTQQRSSPPRLAPPLLAACPPQLGTRCIGQWRARRHIVQDQVPHWMRLLISPRQSCRCRRPLRMDSRLDGSTPRPMGGRCPPRFSSLMEQPPCTQVCWPTKLSR